MTKLVFPSKCFEAEFSVSFDSTPAVGSIVEYLPAERARVKEVRYELREPPYQKGFQTHVVVVELEEIS